ncbi:DUF1631 domain-containing protein [Pseudomonas chlororaphis]|uniref:DUF1631 domain-containing protein n=1 Tax=Pseudomonas chlororaphis TaxID=587753 RepID=UPI0006A5854D|nr:DUF1631 domain-containing protein [Pseudomonas chlororaphis]AZD00070.1 Thymidine phosphorylase [Pseudomonas chlororaphis subsp. chlororaphis]MBM0281948.1 DUF1631 domain-containing protein [Pseudomonas chlororaphis]MDO1504341.1 DUF1631 domain-containing protein [Pseudomonas chlororaphis]ORM49387.1 thymidine phosphorylase [Pseudomonas chlororaphis subsp. chlororaphis]TWR94509.1 DUF1631 domain-containing protein [Pseudomonas chlororaphis subsp. chlororaphis]
MHNDGNVVPLHKVATDQANASPLARLPVILLQVRDKAAQQLRHGLQELFDNADDTLFEMADRAQNNVDQNTFFEAMRDLRLKRKSIERGFLEKLFEAFVGLVQYDPAPAIAQAVAYVPPADTCQDDLERTVALEAMVAKAGNRDGFALGQLTARLNALLGKRLDDRSNPLGPAMLCEYFLESGRSLGVEIKVKLIILKLFERYVLSEADQLYAEANQLLAATGVLPELKPAPARRSIDQAAASIQATPEPGEAQMDESVQQVFAALQELLLHVRGSVVPTLEASAETQPISTRDLLRLLSHLQHYVPAGTQDDFDLRNHLEQLLTRVSVKSGKSRVVGVADEDVINLVAMLFEFILADRNLPESLKTLIGRLQIPMLKVAVLDKSFFSRSSHPARRLLNEIAAAAMGWGSCDDYQRDSLYLRIEQVVQRLLSDFVDDPAIFSELLAEFLAFTSDERRRSELLEQRTRDAEEGRAKAELARRRVERVLNEGLLGKVLPLTVVEFVQQAWSKVLLLTCLKHGEQSSEWRQGLQTMEQLIWSVQRHTDPDAAMQLLALVPDLLKALRDGLNSAAFDPFATSEFFSQLEALHLQAFEHFAQDAGPHRPGVADEQPAMVAVEEHIILPCAEEGPLEAAPLALAANDPGLLRVEQLRLGAWVEFLEDEDNSVRCKLAAIVQPGDKYIFVNRTGMKVLERTRVGLALEFQRGAVRELDDTLLFDRALESVIGSLQRLNRGK